MKLEQAYKIMEVPENVSIDELEDKYMVWIRISKSQEQLKDSISAEKLVNMDQITVAYNTIKNNLNGIDPEATNQPMGFREKLDHFLYHYKFQTFFGIVLALIIGSILYSIIDYRIEEARLANLPAPDIEILLIGEYHTEDVSPLEDSLLDHFPAWERTVVKFEYAPSEARNELDMAALQRRQIIFATEEPDIYIIDLHHFNLMKEMESFQPIEGLSEDLLADIDNSRLHYYKGENDLEEQLYGVDISGSTIFDSVDIIAEEKIVTIRFDSENVANIIDFLEKAISQLD
ncbi:hypothetical protein [Halalkalibacter hemicellulosilyticus]|uniref:Uncharacterized protein n=1 Tax=Halalkalibacter hemicellulosilyticusJCM 9152 TaxID=1236971 RepID=W4QK88_9BACI|nr:hypothetical protein [Halalkalibacter hemicellulosilyticus]GAE32525.1 hypothetical protein JCM9152_4062 [Halalkalibacter hemicellulosilyticusJCM 9152]